MTKSWFSAIRLTIRDNNGYVDFKEIKNAEKYKNNMEISVFPPL